MRRKDNVNDVSGRNDGDGEGSIVFHVLVQDAVQKYMHDRWKFESIRDGYM